MDKHTFDDAIGASPPSTVDVDAIVTRQRRVTVLHRLAGPAAVAAGAVVVLTVGIAIASPGGPARHVTPGGAAGPVATQTVAPSPANGVTPTKADASGASGAPVVEPTSALPECTTPPDTAVVDAALERLTDAARGAFATHAPAVTLTASPGGAWPDGALGPLEFGHVADPTDCSFPYGYVISYAAASDATGTGEILLVLQRAPLETVCAGAAVSPEETFCAETRGPAGEVITAATSVTQSGVTTHRLDVSRPDGTGVTVQSSNGQQKTDDPPTGAAPHLSHAQLTAIALDPALNLFP